MGIISKTIIYKIVGALEIKLAAHWLEGETGTPVLLYLHGNGSPLHGSRGDIAPHMYENVATWKYTLVSADYRLAPQVGIHEICEDVQDSIWFIRHPQGLAALLPKGTIDSTRLAVSGSGGGGYLAQLAGLYALQGPQVVLALYPISDPLGSFFTTSHPWDEADRNGMDTMTAKAALKPLLDRKGKVVSSSTDTDGSMRSLPYKYMLHRGNLAELLHFDLTTNAQRDRSNDWWRITKGMGAQRGHRPNFIIHGSEDDQVDVGQSDEVIGALNGVEGRGWFTAFAQYERLHRYGHAFDYPNNNSKDGSEEDQAMGQQGTPFQNAYMDTMYQFMHRFV